MGGMTTTTIRVGEPRELLAYIPYRLGFRPSESLVVTSIRAPRGRVGLVVRVDLDAVVGASAQATVRSLASHLWRDGAEQVVAVVYVARARTQEGRWRPEVERAAALVGAGLEERVGPTVVWVVDEERYYCFDCGDPACCPREGWPVSDLESTQVSAQMVYAGARFAEHRGELAEVPLVDSRPRYNARRVSRRWRERLARAAGPGERLAWRLASFDAWAEAVELVRRGGRPGTSLIGKIDAALADTLVRDAVVMSCTTGPSEARRALADPAGSERVGAAFDRLFRAGAVPPAPGELEAARTVLREVVAHAPGGAHAPAQSVLALLAWWAGEGAAASCWVERALRSDPAYRLARLVETALELGSAPGWARGEEAGETRLR